MYQMSLQYLLILIILLTLKYSSLAWTWTATLMQCYRLEVAMIYIYTIPSNSVKQGDLDLHRIYDNV